MIQFPVRVFSPLFSLEFAPVPILAPASEFRRLPVVEVLEFSLLSVLEMVSFPVWVPVSFPVSLPAFLLLAVVGQPAVSSPISFF